MIDWRPVPGYIGVYWICPKGIIRNAKGKWLRSINGRIDLRNNGCRESFDVKRLTEEVFGRIEQ